MIINDEWRCFFMGLIYLSPLPWGSLTQRPHEFVHYFHRKTGGKVLWIEPYPTRLPLLSDFRRATGNKGEHTRRIPPWLTVLTPSALPLEPLPLLATLNGALWGVIIRQAKAFTNASATTLVIGKPSALALMLLKKVPVVDSLYDAMDDFPAFYDGISRTSMNRHEREIAGRVNHILVSSTALREKFATQTSQITLVHNACKDSLPTAKVSSSSATRRVVGYVGTLGGWFDWDIVLRLASARPDCIFRLIGPLFSNSVMDLPPNVEILPPLEHALALQAMRDFDVGLIPFKCNRLTASVDPIKYYEYRAMGLPVLSTDFGEMALRNREEGVFLLRTEDNPAVILDNALTYKSDEQSSSMFCEKNSWGERFAAAKLFM